MREIKVLKYGYKFKKFEVGKVDDSCFTTNFDDSAWQEIRVPHDWAITGVFDEMNDPREQHKADADGKRAMYSGTTGALPTVGEGVYRLWVDIPKKDLDKRIILEFDGVMWQSTIYVNDNKVGGCHFGYKSFEVDITDSIKFGEKNLIVVHAAVYENCSRWYSGAGIFRNVRLVTKDHAHIKFNGVWVRQLSINRANAIFELSVETQNCDKLKKRVEIISPDGEIVAISEFTKECGIAKIPYPVLWDVDNPVIYTAVVKVIDENGNVVDNQNVRFGIRSSKFTSEGYFLNGRRLKINGVCMHHDLGSLGAAVSVPAMRRQIEILKEMGVNSIRTSHNPPAPELLDLCDEMGILVMDEFFDEWVTPKVKSGYSNYFDEYAVKDLTDVIKRDRNHPSIIMWSVGNEIREQNDSDGWRVAKLLVEATKAADSTRPVTAGLDAHRLAVDNNIVDYLDIVGLNYKPHYYKQWREEFPDMIILGAETESCVSTRGVYHFPAEVDIHAKQFDDLAVSEYELAAPGWAYYAERELAAQKDCPFVVGEYIWTGFDYLGEPTPYLDKWPSRSSYFGVVDLAGLPKNRFYLYKSVWTNETVLHVFPHWTWHGKEGENVPIHVFTNLPAAELFVNGESQGVRRKDSTNEIDRFRMRWDDVVYTPGEIKVVGYDHNNNIVMEKVIKTAGEPHHIELECNRSSIVADGDDLCYVTATVVDEQGTPCTDKEYRLTFSVSDNVEFLTTDAGDQRETESFYRPDKMTLGAKLVACVSSLKNATGDFTISCSGEGLEKTTITIEYK